MRASRGMGAMLPSKLKAVGKIVRKDNPGTVDMYKEGGMASGKWIQNAIKKPGALRSALGAKAGEPIPAKKLAKAAKAPGKMGQRARLAQTLKKMK